MESWFLADTQAMRELLKDKDFYIEYPEETQEMPWEYIKKLMLFNNKNSTQRGPGNKVQFARKFIRHYFDIRRSAEHPNCPSAKYFVKKLKELGKLRELH